MKGRVGTKFTTAFISVSGEARVGKVRRGAGEGKASHLPGKFGVASAELNGNKVRTDQTAANVRRVHHASMLEEARKTKSPAAFDRTSAGLGTRRGAVN